MKVFVTGASGFVGSHLVPYLRDRGFEIVGSSRTGKDGFQMTGPLESPSVDLLQMFIGVDVIVHLAGFAHDRTTTDDYFASKPYRSNVMATQNVVRAAAAAGVKRIIYLSSVKAFGDFSQKDEIIVESSEDHPSGFYGRSKWQAEQLLRDMCSSFGIDYIILRPALIYGPRVKANFYALIRIVDRFAILPFGSITSRRSMCFIGNLVDAIEHILRSTSPINETFYIADNETLEFNHLLRVIGKCLHKPRWYLPIPEKAFQIVLRSLGKIHLYYKLCASFEVSVGSFYRKLGWRQPYSLDQGIAETVRWYESCRRAP